MLTGGILPPRMAYPPLRTAGTLPYSRPACWAGHWIQLRHGGPQQQHAQRTQRHRHRMPAVALGGRHQQQWCSLLAMRWHSSHTRVYGKSGHFATVHYGLSPTGLSSSICDTLDAQGSFSSHPMLVFQADNTTAARVCGDGVCRCSRPVPLWPCPSTHWTEECTSHTAVTTV